MKLGFCVACAATDDLHKYHLAPSVQAAVRTASSPLYGNCSSWTTDITAAGRQSRPQNAFTHHTFSTEIMPRRQ